MSLAAWTNVVAGALMAALGLVLLFANPRKDWNRLFALLSGFWGVQIVAANAVRILPTAAAARFAGELSLAFLIPLPFFVAMFAAHFPTTPRPERSAAIFVAPAAVSLALLFAAPETLLAAVETTAQGTFTLVWGPAFPYVVVAPLYASLFYALFLMMRRLPGTTSAIERRQVAFVLAALSIFVAYNVPVQLVLFGLGQANEARRAEALVIALVMLGGLALLGLLATRLRRMARTGEPAQRQEARAVLAVVLGAFALGLVVELLAALGGPRLELLGIVRLASVALIVYAIARYQLFDLDLRVKHLATAAAALLVAGALAGAAWAIVRGVGATPALRGAIVAGAGLLALLPVWRLASRLADRVAPDVTREGEHLYVRKLEVYRAAIESRADEAALAELRGKLGLTPREHDVVVSMALARAETRAPAPDLRPGGLAFGKYEIEKLLGEGGYGRVFLARDRILQRPVVIKELQARWRADPAAVRTFLREAQIAGRLNHPNIVSVLEVEQHGEDHYIVMEHMPGGSLEERLRGGALSLEETLRVAEAVLGALDAAHAQGVIHRDVKPANVLLGARGEVKLADFGIAQMAADDPQRTISGLTTGGLPPGTLQYMSPEQARGRALDARSDLYAVGAMLYRMLTGRYHIDLAGLDEFSARAALAAGPAPPAMDGIPRGIRDAIARALAADPAARPSSARELAGALRAAAATSAR